MRFTFNLRWIFVAVFVVAVLTTVGANFYEQYCKALTLTHLVHLTSHGTITWGDEILPLADARGKFSNAIEFGRTNGFVRVCLYIERFADANDDDFKALQAISVDAGFDRVDHKTLSWPTPQHLIETNVGR